MKTVIIGIDSGASGGVAIMFPNGEAQASSIGNVSDLCEILKSVITRAEKSDYFVEAVLEEVTGYIGGKPQPASRSFVLGKSYGSIIGLLIGLEIPFRTVRPQKWQAGLSGLKGISYSQRKRKLKDYAVQMYPHLKPTLKTADAILIANFWKGVLSHEA